MTDASFGRLLCWTCEPQRELRILKTCGKRASDGAGKAACERQAETGVFAARAGRVAPPEPLEQMFDIGLRQADDVIDHVDAESFAPGGDGDTDVAIGGRIFDGVLQEIRENRTADHWVDDCRGTFLRIPVEPKPFRLG